MNERIDRRNFLQRSSAFVLGGALAGSGFSAATSYASAAAAGGDLLKGACIGVFPREIPIIKKFEMAKAAGFIGVEPNTIKTAEEVAEYKKASEATGVKIFSIMNSDHWEFPLTDDDPEVVKKSVDCVKTSMQNAKALGADSILLVPGIVTAQVGYGEVYKRSQETIKKELLPMARELKIVIAIENVGNRFLMSPLEFAQYVDDFDCPYVKAYFDVGNVTRNGFPPDWIRTLGNRLAKVHIKKFESGREYPAFDPKDRRTEGIDWPDVRKALSDVGYKGWVTAEVRNGDEAYLKDLSARMDMIFDGKIPA